uniref:DUF3752 domain-containing protein n=1 Tax=Corethrella appendiculata TaxID=1370023 RepID=U5EZ66_9DIPT
MPDTDTSDSDSKVRYKTSKTRHEYHEKSSSQSSSKSDSHRRHYRSRSRSREKYSRSKRSKSREQSLEKYKNSRKYDKESRHRDDKDKKKHKKHKRSRSKERIFTHSSKNSKDSTRKLDDISISPIISNDECFGPALPPHLQKPKPIDNKPELSKSEIIGPVLPPHLKSKTSDEDIESEIPTNSKNIHNLPNIEFQENSSNSGNSSEDDDYYDDMNYNLIGPMPGTSNAQLEERAIEMRLNKIDPSRRRDEHSKNDTKKREDWMTELPDIRKVSDLGLGARQFRTREKLEIGDRSVWTDTPSDRNRKKMEQSEEGASSSRKSEKDREDEDYRRKLKQRDKEQEEMVKKHKKKHKRDESLLDIHQKKMKKDKKDKNEAGQRRPFDRNVDLQANRFDEAQKKAIFKKAQLLDTRFSRGDSKYL